MSQIRPLEDPPPHLPVLVARSSFRSFLALDLLSRSLRFISSACPAVMSRKWSIVASCTSSGNRCATASRTLARSPRFGSLFTSSSASLACSRSGIGYARLSGIANSSSGSFLRSSIISHLRPNPTTRVPFPAVVQPLDDSHSITSCFQSPFTYTPCAHHSACDLSNKSKPPEPMERAPAAPSPGKESSNLPKTAAATVSSPALSSSKRNRQTVSSSSLTRSLTNTSPALQPSSCSSKPWPPPVGASIEFGESRNRRSIATWLFRTPISALPPSVPLSPSALHPKLPPRLICSSATKSPSIASSPEPFRASSNSSLSAPRMSLFLTIPNPPPATLGMSPKKSILRNEPKLANRASPAASRLPPRVFYRYYCVSAFGSALSSPAFRLSCYPEGSSLPCILRNNVC